ncbi:MAG TPA: hypothetical protein VM782_13430 [Stellaceae bacterium]|nr:hypothetical protein [Stellaceae bacterium]
MESLDESGSGDFVFPDRAAGTRGWVRVFYHRPAATSRESKIVIALHGFDRAAATFRDWMSGPADQQSLSVFVPEFDAAVFPGAHSYNYGNVRLPPPDGTFLPREQWNFGIIDRLFDRVRNMIGSNRKTFDLFGVSAGAQYALRYLALTEAPSVGLTIAANCGWYMRPELDLDYPDGVGGIGLTETDLRRYLGQRLVILLGDADTDPNAHDLPRNEAAMVQGPHRVARGLWHFDYCRGIAERLDTRFGWRMELIPGAVHVDQAIFDAAARTFGADT